MEEVYCPICSDGYYAVRPRVLPCGHSICENCLRLTLEKLQFNCFYCKRSMVIDGKILCPVNYGLEALVKIMIKTDQGLMFNQQDFRDFTLSYRQRLAEQLKEREERRKENQFLLNQPQKIEIVDLELEDNSTTTTASEEETLSSAEVRKAPKVKKIRKRRTVQ